MAANVTFLMLLAHCICTGKQMLEVAFVRLNFGGSMLMITLKVFNYEFGEQHLEFLFKSHLTDESALNVQWQQLAVHALSSMHKLLKQTATM